MLIHRSDRPILLPDQPWEIGARLSAVSALADPHTGDLRLYYLLHTRENPSGNRLCLALSRDGKTWEKPDCGDGTNTVMRSSGLVPEWGVFMPTTILLDPEETNPAWRWKMVYWDKLAVNLPAGICLAVSPDGLSWTCLGDRPIITNANDAMSLLSIGETPKTPLRQGGFLLYQQTWRYNPHLDSSRDNLKWLHRHISVWTCESFANGWVGPVLILEPDKEDPPDLQFYWLTPFPNPQGGYLGWLNCHHTNDQTMDVQLVKSLDGWSWTRTHKRRPILPLGKKGGFDCGLVIAVAQPVLWHGRVLQFYNGRATVHDQAPFYPHEPLPEPADGIGLAEFSPALFE